MPRPKIKEQAMAITGGGDVDICRQRNVLSWMFARDVMADGR